MGMMRFLRHTSANHSAALTGISRIFLNGRNIIAPNEAKIMRLFNDYGPILDWLDLKELSLKDCAVSILKIPSSLNFSNASASRTSAHLYE